MSVTRPDRHNAAQPDTLAGREYEHLQTVLLAGSMQQRYAGGGCVSPGGRHETGSDLRNGGCSSGWVFWKVQEQNWEDEWDISQVGGHAGAGHRRDQEAGGEGHG